MNSGNLGNKSKDTSISLDRRAKIIEYLESKGQVKVNDLSNEFNVSEVTIREEKGLLIRCWGGTIKPQRVSIDYKLYEKSKKAV